MINAVTHQHRPLGKNRPLGKRMNKKPDIIDVIYNIAKNKLGDNGINRQDYAIKLALEINNLYNSYGINQNYFNIIFTQFNALTKGDNKQGKDKAFELLNNYLIKIFTQYNVEITNIFNSQDEENTFNLLKELNFKLISGDNRNKINDIIEKYWN